MNIDGENLVNLDQWKNQKREGNFSDYLKVLSFNDLMNESDNLMDQLKRSEEMGDLFSKTRVMMNEFTHRLEKESGHLAESVKDLKKQIEDKLH
jgi:5-bromo-4-chloroindolyl phosphate hydrolysis protein